MHRMSVVAASTIDLDTAYIYCKGSPESLLKIMNPSGIP
jgi:magnesium-transporting ATPase (P-type)